ncbi:MAG: V-type ATPase subunit [Clostridia bacterium]|nr:V-type ATPase subunit [Clostridia bacterium]
MANISSFIRAKRLGLPVKFFEEGFVGGGLIEKEGFVSIYDGALDALKELCRYTEYRDDVFKLVDDGNLVAFEVSVDNFNLAYWRERYNDLFSVAPMVYYYFAKMTELKAVKLIVAGIKNNVDPALIKERMREIYGA